MVFVILYLIVLFIGAPLTMWYILKQARKFYDEADRIESMIKGGEEMKPVIDAIYLLKDKSFHRRTGDRLRELAKMAEVKYDVKIIKK